MDAAKYKDFIFGMLFLKRASDAFEEHYDRIMQENRALGCSEEEAKQRADDKHSYEGDFFVPPEARWAYIRDEIHDNVGDGLNEALLALEKRNQAALEGVLQHINFNEKVGKTTIPDQKLRGLIMHFNKVRL